MEKKLLTVGSLSEANSAPYRDMLDLERPTSRRRPMPAIDRAAQFSPFAALTGYGDAVEETARLAGAWESEL